MIEQLAIIGPDALSTAIAGGALIVSVGAFAVSSVIAARAAEEAAAASGTSAEAAVESVKIARVTLARSDEPTFDLTPGQPQDFTLPVTIEVRTGPPSIYVTALSRTRSKARPQAPVGNAAVTMVVETALIVGGGARLAGLGFDQATGAVASAGAHPARRGHGDVGGDRGLRRACPLTAEVERAGFLASLADDASPAVVGFAELADADAAVAAAGAELRHRAAVRREHIRVLAERAAERELRRVALTAALDAAAGGGCRRRSRSPRTRRSGPDWRGPEQSTASGAAGRQPVRLGGRTFPLPPIPCSLAAPSHPDVHGLRLTCGGPHAGGLGHAEPGRTAGGIVQAGTALPGCARWVAQP